MSFLPCLVTFFKDLSLHALSKLIPAIFWREGPLCITVVWAICLCDTWLMIELF